MMAKYLNYSTPVYAEFIGIIPILWLNTQLFWKRLVGMQKSYQIIFIFKWPRRQAVKTLPFHGSIVGSNPAGVTN